MSKNIKTIFSEAEYEIVEKKSRFIAYAKPVQTESEAKDFIEKIKKTHYNARHNVFAYIIGDLMRFSDDGEPQGTAGMPILDIMRNEGLTNCVVVVTRYFGGILLGTGGLVRAYGRAAKEALLLADIIEKELYKSYKITVSYSLSGKVQYEALQRGHTIKDTEFTDLVTYHIFVKWDQAGEFLKDITEMTAGNFTCDELEDVYGAMVQNELLLF